MKLILFIIAVILVVANVAIYFIALHFLKQSVDKMQKIQNERKKNNG